MDEQALDIKPAVTGNGGAKRQRQCIMVALKAAV
jgi:hypothetical protein